LNLSVFSAAFASALMVAYPTGAQSPPPWPTAVGTPAPSVTPVPETPAQADQQPSAPTPTATPTPSPVHESADSPSKGPPVLEESDPDSASEGSETAADAAVEDSPKSEKVTNPGAVAFTDYQPFDLDEIEYEPAKTKWKNFVAGLRGIARYNLWDGKLKFRIGARGQFDATAGSGDSEYEDFYLPIESDVAVRRFQLFAAGRVKTFNFNLAFEFGPDWGVSDAWVEGAEGGLEVWGKYLGKLRVGFISEPFSLERQTSSYNVGLMERSLPVQTIAPGTNIGFMVHDSGKGGRFTWAAGIFSFGLKSDANASVSALSLTGRYTHLPVYRKKGRELVHVGLSVSSRSPVGSDTRYRARPEARFVDYLVDTGNIETGHTTLLGAEFATVRGPLWVAAEYILSDISAVQVDNPRFSGSYVQVGWFLTGENKMYRTNSGTFDRTRPFAKYSGGNPFKKKSGGAWEVVGRLSRVDLTDGLVEGGELTDLSAALNWYPNATTRIELNYVHATPKDRGSANIFMLRLQYQPW